MPALTAEARAKLAARNLDARDHPADGPESRSLQERCLAFNAGPPIGLGPYNNFLQIFQTCDAVIIFTEMIHDARIVWTDGRPHAPAAIRQWLGDSRGYWEGKTLIVDTTKFTDKNPFRGAGERGTQDCRMAATLNERMGASSGQACLGARSGTSRESLPCAVRSS